MEAISAKRERRAGWRKEETIVGDDSNPDPNPDSNPDSSPDSSPDEPRRGRKKAERSEGRVTAVQTPEGGDGSRLSFAEELRAESRLRAEVGWDGVGWGGVHGMELERLHRSQP